MRNQAQIIFHLYYLIYNYLITNSNFILCFALYFHFSFDFRAHQRLKLHDCVKQQQEDDQKGGSDSSASHTLCRDERSFLMRARAESHKLLSKEESDKTSDVSSPDDLLR